MRKHMLILFVVAALAGCQSARVEYNGREFDDAATITLKEYVDSLREAATQKPTEEERELFPDGPDLVPSETTHLIRREFQVLYIDERYVSFRADMMDYHGGNGNHSQVFVGSIDRKSGRVLGVVDFVPKSKWPVLKQKLYDGAVKKIEGKENLQGEVEVIENFYYAKDGLHFVYNPYEIACGATGSVEVVIDPKTL